ncbi:DUF3951 domain-containing protein [Priestia filamentosa]|nr:DUF3951 domain-containing protein [Priestia filamentosa]MDT3762308.1 DUF3951 domain-containing protein [Priestia filamentosa]OXS68871.1 DUF3951 domain-containing protein [Priestia filamentosa]RJS64424.1 DUF3951 domain-containing protein [Priestia filamentosa]WCM17384.1 DUF3951 domain-containing protein [Priestia filamentosa]WRU96788.1 DUF3951 domain-containing protein [Priestia filamentosa]
MLFLSLMFLTFTTVFILIVLVACYKFFILKRTVSKSHYTPFDYITGQNTVEFHEEENNREEDNDNGEKFKKSPC